MRHLLLTLCLLGITTPSLARAKLQEQAPAFTLKTYAGKAVSLKELEKRWVLLAFWWSNTDKPERYLKYLEALHNRYKKSGLVIVAINYDRSRGWGARIWKKVNPSYMVLHDSDNHVFDKYLVRMGGAVLVNPAQKVVHITKRAMKDLQPVLEKQLGGSK